MTRNIRRCAVLLSLALLMFTPLAYAWQALGHMVIAKASLQVLPDSMPAFFRTGWPDLASATIIADCSVDPDSFKSPTAPQLKSSEEPEHFIDLELLQNKPLPDTRRQYVELCQELKVNPFTTGFLPYTLAEWTQRLTLAFAEHRRWPENKAIQAKCLVYAGILAHYAGDACQPLHCTIHHNGRVSADNHRPHARIHVKVDGIIEWLKLDAATIAKDLHPEAFPKLMPAIINQIMASNKLVDQVYELEKQFPDEATARKSGAPQPIVDFAHERAHAGAQFLAGLYLTAWADSQKVTLVPWLVEAHEQDAKP